MNFILVLPLISTMVTLAIGQSVNDYITLGKPCDPSKQHLKPNNGENRGVVCFPELHCNNKTYLCECADSPDGRFKRTFQGKECKLLPGSTCVRNVDQDNYRCVENSQCKVTREGQDPSTCPADAFCDTGDAECICKAGKTCLDHVVETPPL